MEREVRGVFAQLGEDPRDYSLIAFGGGGPLYATSLAREMKIPRVVVPVSPGTFSAMGLIVSDIRHDYVRTRLSRLVDTDFHAVQSVFEELEDQALNDFSAVGIGTDQVSFSRILDLRYSGQGYELGQRHVGLDHIVHGTGDRWQARGGGQVPLLLDQLPEDVLLTLGALIIPAAPAAPVQTMPHESLDLLAVEMLLSSAEVDVQVSAAVVVVHVPVHVEV